MKKLIYLYGTILIFCLQPLTGKAGEGLHLVIHSASQYSIIIPRHPAGSEEKAAYELQRLLKDCSGVLIPVRQDVAPVREYEIIIGSSSHLLLHHIPIDFKSLQKDGFTLLTRKNVLVIAGGAGKGSLYGVYTFLEKYIGFRLYTPDDFYIPRKETILVPAIQNDTQVPVIDSRLLYYYDDAKNDFFKDWHKLNHFRSSDAIPDWGLWVHTFTVLLPPSEYFNQHPEYYALVNGKRLPTQLCLSNPQVFSILVQNLKRRMAALPGATYWSVSQNDNSSYCTCDECKKIDREQGSPSGSVISFVNKVAACFPDKIISTLAYQYTRKAPEHIQIAKNVNIMFCSIECNRSQPIDQDSLSASFRKDMEDWSRLTDNILVWDYVIQFKNLLSPFPNLFVLQPNIQFFVKNHAKAIFEQGNREKGGEMAALRQYLLAKLLWNPEIDIDSTMNDFLRGYYGKAWENIRTYISTMQDALTRSGQTLDIFASPVDQSQRGYLRNELTGQYLALFDKAEQEVKNDSLLWGRVREAKMPLEYALLTIAASRGAAADGLFEKINDSSRVPKKEFVRMLEDFNRLCVKLGVTRLHEWDTRPEEFYSMMQRIFAKSFTANLAYNRPVHYQTKYDSVNAGGGGKALTDGICGAYEFRYGWQGFLKDDLDATIDLGKVFDLHEVEAGFLQILDDGIFLPKQVRFYTSIDGVHFDLLDQIQPSVPEKTPFKILDIESHKNVRARYLRILANNLGMCPDWHSGAGFPCWLFADEIRVR